MKTQWLERALFVAPFYYTLCTTEDQFEQELRGLDVPRADWPAFVMNAHSNATAHRFTLPDGQRACIVCMPPATERDQVEVVGLLIHEAVHLWQWVCEQYGEAEPGAESEAYGIQRLAQQLIAEYRRQVYP